MRAQRVGVWSVLMGLSAAAGAPACYSSSADWNGRGDSLEGEAPDEEYSGDPGELRDYGEKPPEGWVHRIADHPYGEFFPVNTADWGPCRVECAGPNLATVQTHFGSAQCGPIVAEAMIVNCGPSSTPEGFVDSVYAGDPDDGGQLLSEFDVGEALPGGEGVWTVHEIDADRWDALPRVQIGDEGVVSLHWVADSGHVIDECDESQLPPFDFGC